VVRGGNHWQGDLIAVLRDGNDDDVAPRDYELR
jgi:hypothetical protein